MAAEKARKEEELKTLKKKCDELQMLKFGMLVDLDMLNTSAINHAAEELKVCMEPLGLQICLHGAILFEVDAHCLQDKQAELQAAHDRQMRALSKDIEDHQLHLTELTRRNTALLTSIATLETESRELEKALNSKQRAVTMPPSTLVRCRPFYFYYHPSFAHAHVCSSKRRRRNAGCGRWRRRRRWRQGNCASRSSA
jgi:hypothetical protein